MNLLKGSMLAIALLFIAHGGYSQEKKEEGTKPDTLKLSVAQAQQYALENNRSILNANLDIESAKKKVWETTAMGLPQVSGKLAYSYQITISPIAEQIGMIFGQDTTKAFNINDLKWGLTGDLTVSQLIFSGSYLVGLQSAKVYKSLSQLNQIKSKQDVIESVVNSYYNVLIARENRSILDSTYQNLLKTLSDIQSMGKVGFVEETDIDQMQITTSSIKYSLDFITRQTDIAEKLLKLQLGIDIDKPIVLTDNLAILINSLSYEKLLSDNFSLENNVNYQMLDANVKANSLLLKLRKSEFLPDIAAFYQKEKQFNTNAVNFNPPDLVGVSMNIPIFSSGARMARVSQAKVEYLKAQNNRDQSADGLKVDYYNNKALLQNSIDKYNTESNNLKLAKKIYNRALIKYTNGMISSIDLTTIQNQYLTAQSNYYIAIQNLISSKNKLEKTLTKSDFTK